MESRTFLLYVGPYLFKPFLPFYYNHFLLLHFAMYVYESPSNTSFYIRAENCLETFVSQFTQLFCQKSLVHNVNVLLHLSFFVKLYGSPSSFSAFPFENYLGILKRRIKATYNVFKHTQTRMLQIRKIFYH